MNHQKLYHEVKRQKWCPSARILEGPATYFRERPVGKGIPYAHDNFARCNELAAPSCVRTVLGLAPTPQLSKGSWGNTCRIPRASAPVLTNQNVHNSLCERWHFVFLSFRRDKILDVQMDKFEICPETWQKDKWSKCKSSTKTQSALLHIEKLRNAKRKSVFHVVGKRQIWNLSRMCLTNFKSVEHSSTKHKSAPCQIDMCKVHFCVLSRIPRQICRGFLDKNTKCTFANRQLAKCKSAICVFVEDLPLTDLKSVFWSTLQNALLCFVETSSTDLSRVKFVFSEICGDRFVWGGDTDRHSMLGCARDGGRTTRRWYIVRPASGSKPNMNFHVIPTLYVTA